MVRSDVGVERSTPRSSETQSWVRKRYPSLDPLRAIAITLVFSVHYLPLYSGRGIFQFGWVGVDMFFVLSGFLITGILYDSREDEKFFRNFYIRRTLRIFPLYYGFFAVVLLLWPWEHGTSRTVFTFAGYVGNFVPEYVNILRHNPTVIMWRGQYAFRIDHFWSLCVEEQFYLVWPLVVWIGRTREKLMRICILAIAGTFVLRTFLFFRMSPHFVQNAIYGSTYTRCDELFAGGILALWIREQEYTRAHFRAVAHWATWPALLLLLIGVSFSAGSALSFLTPFMATIGYDLLALLFVGVLMWSIDETSALSRLLRSSRRLAALGTVSYGFYVFHELYEPMVQRWLVPRVNRHFGLLLVPVLVFGFTWLLAWISFNGFEKHLLGLKDRLAPPHRKSSFQAAVNDVVHVAR